MRILQHIKCGRHSGFPLCCIAWYSTVYRLLGFIDEKWTGKFEQDDRLANLDGTPYIWQTDGLAYRYLHLRQWGYVPCPACILRGNKVEVKSCDCFGYETGDETECDHGVSFAEFCSECEYDNTDLEFYE